MPVSAQQNTTDDEISKALSEISSSKEFARYSDHAQALCSWVIANEVDAIKKEVSTFEQQASERREYSQQQQVKVTNRSHKQAIFGFALATFFMIAGIALILVAAFPTFTSSLITTEQLPDLSWWVAAPLTFGALVLASTSARMALSNFTSAATSQLLVRSIDSVSKNSTAAILRSELSSAYSRAITEVLGPKGILAFPEQGPRLVQLSNDDVAPSATIQYVHKFIGQHETSAIGISGPRGIGKSTLLRSLYSDPELARTRILVPMPVEYDPIDLLRRICFELADNRRIADPDPYVKQLLRRGRRTWGTPMQPSLLVFGVFLYIGAGLVTVDVMEPQWISSLGGLTLAGIICVLVGIIGIAASADRSRHVRRFDGENELADAELSALITEIRYELANSAERRGEVGWSGLALKAATSSSTKTHGLSHSELSQRLRRVLTLLEPPVLLCFDELDKLPDRESLVRSINALKDLFGIAGVHIVVTVSEEALVAFQMRGLEERDAFDSSFDLVVSLGRLTTAESRDVLTAKVAGFPDQLIAICHVSSGGLPRDLLRAARRFIEIHQETDGAISWEELAKQFVATDVRKRLNSIAKAADLDFGQATRILLDPMKRWITDGPRVRDVQAALCDDKRISSLGLYCLASLGAIHAVRDGANGDSMAESRIEELAHAVENLSFAPQRSLALLLQVLPLGDGETDDDRAPEWLLQPLPWSS